MWENAKTRWQSLLLALFFSPFNVDIDVVGLFDAYDKFVGLLADNKPTASGEPPRSHLGNLSVDDLESDTVFQEARQIRKEFGTALSDLFLKPGTELYNLVIEYGVF